MKNPSFVSISSICIFLLFTCLTGCQKELSFESGQAVTDSMALFAFVPSGSQCTSVNIPGTIQAGLPLNQANLVEVEVKVTRKGTWSYNSATINGIHFTGAGNFTGTGTQTMLLYGNGTPLTAGEFVYNISSTTSQNCSFAVSVIPAGNNTGGGNTNTGLYYKAEIGGIAVSQYVTDTNGFIAGSSSGGLDDVSLSADISNGDHPSDYPYLEITKGLLHNYLAASDATFKAFFAPGVFAFAKEDGGFRIYYQDKSGAEWTSFDGSGDQAGSLIKIISVADEPAVNGYYIRVKIEFSCNLFNTTTGEKKLLKNGEFVGIFGKI